MGNPPTSSPGTPFTPPPATPLDKSSHAAREQEQGPPISLHELTPNSPRERDLVESFKKTIVLHLDHQAEKTTLDFLNDLALDLWRLTRST